MVCIYCNSATQVINSRPQKKLNHIWRRRECLSCMAVFTTSESPDLFKGIVVETNGKFRAFSRDKLFLSIHDSLRHRNSVISDATALTDTVISRTYPIIKDGTINSSEIIKIAATTLKRFDKAAAIYYAAYHPVRK